jgi:hypothetical protein
VWWAILPIRKTGEPSAISGYGMTEASPVFYHSYA